MNRIPKTMNEHISIFDIITPEQMLNHWQGHRNLTRRVIDAFPEDKLFTYSIGGMRPFADMARELTGIAGMGVHGLAYGEWNKPEGLAYWNDTSDLAKVNTKEKLLEIWDNTTDEINRTWPEIPEGRFQEEEVAFGQYDGTNISHLLYFIDNEIHHRGQGYVYLRSLDIEPPYFWERGRIGRSQKT
jgi:uncharacterized damage-inducible protein DinB